MLKLPFLSKKSYFCRKQNITLFLMEMIFIQLASSLFNMPAATAELRQNAPLQHINVVNWEQFDYRPQVTFRAGWNEQGLLIDFQVEEQHILSSHTELHAPAYKDSCVEFFYSPTSDNSYYNLEMSCTGARLWHHKTADGQKTTFEGPDLEKIVIATTLPAHTLIDDRNGGKWGLTVFIPAECLPEGFLVSGRQFTANFYKCGDDTMQKHYLTWAPIPTEKPSFHQPAYFGKITLQ